MSDREGLVVWNTGCCDLHNNTGIHMCCMDAEGGEGTAGPKDLPAGSTVSWGCHTIFPWCINSQEIRTKAFRFYETPLPSSLAARRNLFARPPAFYLFQAYRDDQVYLLVPNGTEVRWSDRRWCGEGPSSYVNVFISEGRQVHVSAR